MRLLRRNHKKTLAHIKQLERDLGFDEVVPENDEVRRAVSVLWEKHGDALVPARMNITATYAASASSYQTIGLRR